MSKHGALIAIGGGEDKTGEREILREVASRVNGAPLVLATIASHEPEGYLEAYHRAFEDLGVGELRELYLNERSEANDEAKLALLEGAGGIFFTGGDQLRITSLLADTPIEKRMRQLHRSGVLIAGTSAGASMMSETMLIGGPDSASYRIADLRLGAGLALVRNVIIDQHFAERGRIGRLLGAVAQNPRVLGIGIDEDTCVIIEGDRFSVAGNGAVYIVDGAHVSCSNIADGKAEETMSIYGVTLHVLTQGDEFDLGAREPGGRA